LAIGEGKMRAWSMKSGELRCNGKPTQRSSECSAGPVSFPTDRSARWRTRRNLLMKLIYALANALDALALLCVAT